MTTDTTLADPAINVPPEQKSEPRTDDTAALKRKRDELLAENTKYKNTFKSYGGVEGALQRLADLEAAQAEAEANREAEAAKANNVEAVKSTYEKKLTDAKTAYDALAQRLVRTHIDTLIASAVTAEKGSLKLLGPHLSAAVTGALDKDGTVQASIKGPNGEPVESIADLVKALKQDEAFGAAFDATEIVGAGTRQSSAKVTGNPFAAANESIPEQMRLIAEKPADATRLALAAGWAKHRITW